MKGYSKTALLVGAMLASAPAFSQTGSQTASSSASRAGLAAASFQVPVGMGADWGNVGVGVYGQTLNDDEDGSAGLAFGLGDANKYAGLEVTVGSSSLFGDQGSDESFGDSGAFGLKLHTNLPGFTSVAIGVSGVGRWGDAADLNTSSVYAVASKYVPLGKFAAIVNLGVGDGFYGESDEEGPNVFGSASFYFTQWLSVIGEYTGRFTNVAVSVSPFRSLPLTFTAGAINLGENDGGDTEFGGTIGYGFAF